VKEGHRKTKTTRWIRKDIGSLTMSYKEKQQEQWKRGKDCDKLEELNLKGSFDLVYAKVAKLT